MLNLLSIIINIKLNNESEEHKMFCPKCGKVLDEDEVFCSNCGTRIDDNANGSYQNANNNSPSSIQGGNYQSESITTVSSKKPVNKKIIAVAVVLFAIIIFAMIALVISNGKISAEDYISDEINFKGYNGYATVSATDVFDYDRLITDLGQSNYSGTDSSIINSIVDYGSDYTVESHISVSFDKSENLKNGDEITAIISIDYGMINSMNFEKELTGKDTYSKTYTVSGLEDAEGIDPFGIVASVNYDIADKSSSINFNNEYIEDFGEYNAHYYEDSYGNAQLEIVNSDNNPVAYVSYSSDGNSYSSTKQVTVNAKYTTTDYYTDDLIILPLSKQYEPLIIDYLKTADCVSSEAVSELQKHSFDELNSYDGPKLQKVDFLYENEQNEDKVNAVAYIYSYNFKFDNSTLYIAVYAENIKVNDSEEITNLDDIFFRKTSSSNSIGEVEEELKSYGWSVSEISVD